VSVAGPTISSGWGRAVARLGLHLSGSRGLVEPLSLGGGGGYARALPNL
jgi:hypothetical protein